MAEKNCEQPLDDDDDNERLSALVALLEMLAGEGYEKVEILPSGELAGLRDMMFTVGLFVGLDSGGYRIRYCYKNRIEATLALEAWDGEGDPPGPWLKAKGIGLDGHRRDDLGPGA
jgi:hypothetical protein